MGEIPRQEEPDIYRDNLAEQLKDSPKKERKELLESAKETPEYQKARGKKIEKNQEEESINDGLGVFIKNKTLYHGSRASGIEKFKRAEETTVGEGLYCTSKPEDAINYAHHRATRGRQSMLYEVSVDNMKLLDLRKDDNVKKVMKGFADVIWSKASEINDKINSGEYINDRKHDWSGYRDILFDAFDKINSGKVGVSTIQEVTLHLDVDIFNDYVTSMGYDGLVTMEGGEGEFRNIDHDSYVIFDPEKAKIIREQKIKKPEKK